MIHALIHAVRGFLSGDGTLILPEMELILFACGILVIDRWLAANEKHWNAVLALGGTAFSGFTLFVQYGKWQALRATNPDSPGLVGLHQSLLVDPFFLFFAALFLTATALIVLLSARSDEKEQASYAKQHALMLFGCVGMMLMVSGVDLIAVLLGLEITGLSSYLLTGLSRNGQGTPDSGKKYTFLWACSSCALGAGFLLLYQLFQTTNLGRMGAILDVRLNNGVPFAGLTSWHAALALALLAIGAFFLIDAAPLHWFAPGICESAPTPAAAYLSTAAKIASFALLLRFFSLLFLFAHEKWIYVWGGVAIVSLLWGNVAALRQTNLKRVLAYGAVAHTGFLLLGLAAENEIGFSGMLYYLAVYVFMTAGAFGILMILEQHGDRATRLADLDGLYQRSLASALLLLVFMMSLAGIPPTGGFLAKYFIVKALIAARHPSLAAFAILNALTAAYYYGRVAARAWKRPPAAAPEAAPLEMRTITISNGQTVALTAAVFVSLAAGLYPELFLRLARYAFGQ
jgi:NADH-quinone oxidoreductase subunit N